MSKSLEERLRDAKNVLDDVNAAFGRHPGALKLESEVYFRKVVDLRSDIDHWIGMLGIRAIALQFLDGLESKADPADDCIQHGDNRIKFQVLRFTGVQSYITTAWALADSITRFAGLVLCISEGGLNEIKPAKLFPHFMTQERKKILAAALCKSIRYNYGWASAILYAIRNHFIHEGAQTLGSCFFAGSSAASAFSISDAGYRLIEDRAQKDHGMDESNRRPGVVLSITVGGDLREVLEVCQRETDDVLGILLGTACHSLRAHAAFILGED